MNSNISIIITCYNYGRFLQECVDSVVNQTILPAEVIIVNDDSTDDTENISLNLGNIIRSRKISFTYKKHENVGLAKSCNRGFEVCGGKYVLFLDADDMLSNDYLEKCLEVIEKFSYDFAVTGNEFFGTVRKRVEMWNPTIFNLITKFTCNKTALFKREIFEKCGGYNDIPWEDVDFYIRAYANGFRGGVANTYLKYRQHNEAMTVAFRKNEFFLFGKIFIKFPRYYHWAAISLTKIAKKSVRQYVVVKLQSTFPDYYSYLKKIIKR